MTQVPTPAGSPPTVDGRNEQDFARIWGRVMPLEQAGCPIRVGRPPEESPSAPPQEREDMCPSTPAVPEVPTPLPCPREVPPPSRAHISPATQPDVPLLGSGSAIYGEQLQMYIDQEAADWRTYLSLSRRSPGGCARVLAAMAAEERRHAKRLSAAYFLISGVRYFPSESSLPTPRGALPAALRQCFCAEQRGALAYLAAAEECSDPALRALYQELARDEARHAQLLRELVEEL